MTEKIAVTTEVMNRLHELEEFVGAVVFGHLEMHEMGELSQCPWCLWVPWRDWDPVHDCPAKKWSEDATVRDAWERTSEEDIDA